MQAARNGGANPETAGTVTFFGKVVENTCKVKTENRDMSVVLNDVGKSHFKNKGDTAMPTPFTITLTDCATATTGTVDTKAKKVGLYFYSWENADKENDYTLKNMTGNDKAQNVNIQIFKENGVDAIKVVDKETEDFTSQNTNNGATVPTLTNKHISGSTQLAGVTELPLHFIAQYYSTDATVTAGKVQTSVNFQIAYE
ncbi:Major fimbrial subunit precursor [Haemophilus influenzae]|uniref:Major fimbrial subunit n=1 Tax=Haemophilus influenzae TaxID=727 RepID=A0A2S9RN02_HAEIF|nr:Major fimbrial subunit precursor [Haemophilus influenzae]